MLLSNIMLLLFFPFVAIAESVELTCGKDGVLLSFGKVDLASSKVKAVADPLGRTCDALGQCFKDFQKGVELGKIITNSLDEYLKRMDMVVKDKSVTEIRENIDVLRDILYSCQVAQTSYENVKPKERLSLSYPFKGPNKNKSSTGYDAKRIEEILEIAISRGADPFLSLGIVLLENPPISAGTLDGYALSYGIIPVDATAVVDWMKCPVKKIEGGISKYIPKEDFANFNKIKGQIDSISKKMNEMPMGLYNDLMVAGKGLGNYYSVWLKETKKNEGSESEGIIELQESPFQNEAFLLEFSSLSNTELCQKISVETKKCSVIAAYLRMTVEYDKLDKSFQSIMVRATSGDEAKLDSLQCLLDKNNCKGMVESSRKEQRISLKTSDKEEKSVCYAGPTLEGGPPGSLTRHIDSSGKCCLKVVGSSDLSDQYVDGQIRNTIAIDFITSKIKVSSMNDLTYQIQKYNGVGCATCTEFVGVDDRTDFCISGMHFGDSPYYGARVADLMLNMLMNNPEIMNRAIAASKASKKPVKSLFCQGKNNTKVVIDSEKFLNEQKDYLLKGSEKKYRSKFKNKIAIPSNAEELALYKAREEKRRVACEKYFK